MIKFLFIAVFNLLTITSVLFCQNGWKNHFTFHQNEGKNFSLDTSIYFQNSSVPTLHISQDSLIILALSSPPQNKFYEIKKNGFFYQPLPSQNRGLDGAFIYLPDGNIRFLNEEILQIGSHPNLKRRTRIISFISNDGINWQREQGIRYQPGIMEDSIASVPCTIQIQDNIWRMYYVGDWYNTNGIRTAISTDWGLTWSPESINNILRRGDVDPHIVYLSNNRFRLYFRSGMRPPNQSGIAFCDSEDGILFDTLNINFIIKDSEYPHNFFKLDPALIKFKNGKIACYLGAVNMNINPPQERTIILFNDDISKNEFYNSDDKTFELEQNFPNPFGNGIYSDNLTTIRYTIPNLSLISSKLPAQNLSNFNEMKIKNNNNSFTFSSENNFIRVSLKIYDILGREIETLVDEFQKPGEYSVKLRM